MVGAHGAVLDEVGRLCLERLPGSVPEKHNRTVQLRRAEAEPADVIRAIRELDGPRPAVVAAAGVALALAPLADRFDAADALVANVVIHEGQRIVALGFCYATAESTADRPDGFSLWVDASGKVNIGDATGPLLTDGTRDEAIELGRDLCRRFGRKRRGCTRAVGA